MFKYVKNSKQYLLAEPHQRIVYQNVNRLKTPNGPLSVLYLKTSDNDVDFDSKIGLLLPDFKWSVQSAYLQLK